MDVVREGKDTCIFATQLLFRRKGKIKNTILYIYYIYVYILLYTHTLTHTDSLLTQLSAVELTKVVLCLYQILSQRHPNLVKEISS